MTSRPVPAPLQHRISYGITAAGRSGKIIVFGGTQTDWNGALRDTWIYDVGTDTWHDVTDDIKPPRGMPRADALKLDLTFDPELGRALLFTVPVNVKPAYFRDWPDAELWSFDPDNYAWNPVPVEGLSLAYGSLPAFNQPLRPHGMTASVESTDRVTLRWAANDEPDVVGDNVYRKDGSGATRRINAAPVPGTSFIDTTAGLGDGLLRSYYVRAVNQAQIESGASPLAFSMPDAPRQFSACVDASHHTATVRWQWPANHSVSGFKVYVNDHHENTLYYNADQRAAWWAEWQSVTPTLITAHQVQVTFPDPAKDYYFCARAVSVLGQEGFFTDIASATDPRFKLAAPHVFEVCDTIYSNGFELY